MFTLTTSNTKEPVKLTAETLRGVVSQVEEYTNDNQMFFSYDNGIWHIWFTDQETGFSDNGGPDAIDANDDPEYPDWVHKGPLKPTIENVTKYASYILDVHPANITITES